MDLFDLLLQVGLVTAALVSYLIFFKRPMAKQIKANYKQTGWNYYFRLLLARFAVKLWKSQRPPVCTLETPRHGQEEGWDCIAVRASAPDGSVVYLSIRKLYEKPALSEVVIFVKLPDGTIYKQPNHPTTVTGLWEDVDKGWSAGGLKIEVLEYQKRMRIVYNGLLKTEDGVIQHVRFNFIWASASTEHRYPEDWSDQLAARSLALEPWQSRIWLSTLDKWKNGSCLHWGAVQGRFECYTREGGVDKSVNLRVRGVKERSWSPLGYQGLRRTLTITAAARDGTAVMLHGFSYKDVLTSFSGFYGCVRFPDFSVQSITDTDLDIPNFCEKPEEIPKVYSINVSTNRGTINLVIRINADGGSVLSGVPHQQEVVYRTAAADIDGVAGAGLLELGYYTNKPGPVVNLPQLTLRWARETQVPEVGYCVSFEDQAASCPSYVGGKGASLALLASVQEKLGYRVPPGYCLTTKALTNYLETNPHIKAAIREIEAANENYDENIFRKKCKKAVDLFASTEIVGEVREEIISHLNKLRTKALEQNLGPELRFAVRSSAVGEDSEALSAAGQNETILGCVSDQDVLRGVQLCWGSMFAFTSAHYRRQNGQQCLCGGAVVVQALVEARAAGVMFTRHPARGDPAALLLTANYGLGESVVSGTVEPDTIIVSRGKELSISKIELGSKKHKVMAAGNSVDVEEVSESERRLPCLSEKEMLELARIGVAQEEAWGAGRDIEWAVTKEEIYLLQARPITSLDRWTEEELLHELDTPIMADDELITFANTGEVLPKPVTALSYDMMLDPLADAMGTVVSADISTYDRNVFVTHGRAVLSLYNSFYRMPPKEVDVMTRMVDLSISGNSICNDDVIATANKRRKVTLIDQILKIYAVFKFIIVANWAIKDAIKIAKNLKVEPESDTPLALLRAIENKKKDIYRVCVDHGTTSAGSSTSQFIAMIVLIEGNSDFTAEQCNELSKLLSSGDVLSAEVPQILEKITKRLHDSGIVEEFRAQDPKKALDWLKVNLPNIHSEVCQFLEEHGHRAIMEFDYYTKPWALVPEEMMELLQHMRVTNDEKPKQKNDEELIKSLKSPKKSSTKSILRWILPLCRRNVRFRENTKSHLCLSIHKIRLAMRRLGKLMVKEWYIPDEELVFHFRLRELGTYLLTRDPAILRKAIQRRQYHPSWCKLKFEELHTGWVEPLKYKAPVVTSSDVKIQATVVCGGEIVARACVVKELSEIGQLQRGDILITHSTDIGWSPYFPLLSGIVTELGGLISHGAVIAREYGLPCVVGAAHATDMFRTGDMVRLAASEGTLERVLLIDKADVKSE